MDGTDCIQVLTTVDSEQAADRIGEALIDGRLAACVQVVGPIVSHYRWQGKVERDREWQCLAKTTAARYGEVEAEIRRLHSYDEPEVIATPIVGGSDEYLAWIEAEVSGK